MQALDEELRAAGWHTWLDDRCLIPGQDWEYEVRKAVRETDVVVVCLSHAAVTQAGWVHKEIKLALDVADQQPEGAIFLIPVKLEVCEVPERLTRWQWVSFENEGGRQQLFRALTKRAEDLGLLAPSVGAARLRPRRTLKVLIVGGIVLSSALWWLASKASTFDHAKAVLQRTTQPGMKLKLPQELIGRVEKGDLEAMFRLARLYADGEGVPKDLKKARELLQRAADAGHPEAMYTLGTFYDDGEGGVQNYATARTWYLRAARAGSSDAMNDLGVLYEYGRGVKRDYVQAKNWYQKGIDLGNKTAMFNLASLLDRGLLGAPG